jgi:Uma2 family endonuclease
MMTGSETLTMVVFDRPTTEVEILAQNVSFEEYMEKYAEHHTEWVAGMVIKMSPVTRWHDRLTRFFVRLLGLYLYRTKAGVYMAAPFVMKVRPDLPGREPDLQIVLADRTDIIKDTMTVGPADVVIEIVSESSIARDRGDKFAEYQAGGVREYWLIDALPREADFYRLGDDGLFHRIELQAGVFRSTILPRFQLEVSVLWQTELLEDDEQIRALVDTMLKTGD